MSLFLVVVIVSIKMLKIYFLLLTLFFSFLNRIFSQEQNFTQIQNLDLVLENFDINSAPVKFYLFYKEPTVDSSSMMNFKTIFDCVDIYDPNKISQAEPQIIDGFQKQYLIKNVKKQDGSILKLISKIGPQAYGTFFIQVDTSRFDWKETECNFILKDRLDLVEVEIENAGSYKLFRIYSVSNAIEMCWKLNRALLFFTNFQTKTNKSSQEVKQKGSLEVRGNIGGLFGQFKYNGNPIETSPGFNSNFSLMYRWPLSSGKVYSSFGMSLTHSQNQVKIVQENYSFLYNSNNPALPVNKISITSSIPVVESIHWVSLGLSLPVQLEVYLGNHSDGLSWICSGSIGYNFFMPAEAHLTQGRFNYRGVVNSISDPLINIPEWNLEENVDVNRFSADRFLLEGFNYDLSTGFRYTKKGFFTELKIGFLATNFYLNDQNPSTALTLQPGHYSTSLRNGERISGTFFSTAISIGHQFH